MSSTIAVTVAPNPLIAALHQSRLRQRERHEHPDHVERDEGVGVAAEPGEQQPGECAQDQNAIRKCQPIALIHELTRQESIPSHDRRQPREIRIRRVRRQHQDRHRCGLHGEVEEVAPTECNPGNLRDHRLPFSRGHVVGVGEKSDAHEHGDGQRRHGDERRSGVTALRRPECRDAIRDRLDAGHGRAPIRKRGQQHERRQGTAPGCGIMVRRQGHESTGE
jgi:hypothetical protein